MPGIGSNSSRYDINLIKEYLLALLVKQKLTPPEVIKKTNQYVSFYFDKIQFLDILNFLGGATSLDSFLKAYQTTETKGFFPYEWFDCAEKLNETCLPPIGCFWSQLKNCNVLSAERDKYTKLLENGMSQALACKKMGISSTPPTAEDNYAFLQTVWEENRMSTFLDFLKWYNDKDVIPTLEAMQKMM